jgi:hypothetical protein
MLSGRGKILSVVLVIIALLVPQLVSMLGVISTQSRSIAGELVMTASITDTLSAPDFDLALTFVTILSSFVDLRSRDLMI